MRSLNEHIELRKKFCEFLIENAEDIDFDNVDDIVIDLKDDEEEEDDVDITKGEMEDDGKDKDPYEPSIYENRRLRGGRITKRTIQSNKVVSQVSKELFGENGIHRNKVEILFKLYRTALRKKAAEMKVPASRVKNTKLVLRAK